MQTSYSLQDNGVIKAMAFLTPDLTMDCNRWILNRITVVRGTPFGEGWGTKLLSQICERADEEGAILWLGVDPDPPCEFKRLVNWYERYSFVPMFKNINRVHNVMVRKPNAG